MDVGSTLIGSLTGKSTLFYYGTNVANTVTTGRNFSERLVPSVDTEECLMVLLHGIPLLRRSWQGCSHGL